MKILDLSLTHHWYDEIRAGRKTEEYREMTDFYCNRILDKKEVELEFTLRRRLELPLPDMKDVIKWFGKKYDAIRFHRGQGSPITMLVECLGITVGKGKPDLGAPADKEVFIIKLGRILSDTSGRPNSSHKK